MSWQTQENSWLHGRVEDLERQLRRRTIVLGASTLAAVAALAGLTAAVLRGPESPPAAAWTDSIAEALSDPRFPAVPSDGGEQQATAGEGDADLVTARAALSAAMARIEELEAADAEREATIAELRAELDSTHAEAQTLRERLDVSRQGIERLNALLARAVGAEPSAAPSAPAELELSAAAPLPAETEPSAAPSGPAEAAAPGPPAETGGDEPPTAGGDLYIATGALNLRAEPTPAAAVLAVIDEGDVVRRVGGEGEWVQVEHADLFMGVVTGWVYGELVRPAAATLDEG